MGKRHYCLTSKCLKLGTMVSFFGKIKQALSSTSGKIASGITNIMGGRKLDINTIEELEELLITADMGAHTASAIMDKFRKQKFSNHIV